MIQKTVFVAIWGFVCLSAYYGTNDLGYGSVLHSKLLVEELTNKGSQEEYNVGFINGNVFTGDGFEKKNLYSLDGILSFRRPEKLDTTIDVTNSFIIPPFGEAHNHNLGEKKKLDKQVQMYLTEGVFYSKNLHYLPGRTHEILGLVNTPQSVDVVYAHAGLTATGGHVFTLYQNLFKWKVLTEFATLGELDTRAYFTIDNLADLNDKWEKILAMKPDIIKTYLEYSEDYRLRKNDTQYTDEKGLSLELLKEVVFRARKKNLPVSVHIETAQDFRNALYAGVNEIAHLPGFRISDSKTIEDYKLDPEDAKLAAKNNVSVITTTSLARSFNKESPETLKKIRDLQIENISLLKRYGVDVVLGSDNMNKTVMEEVTYMKELNVYSNLELLRIMVENTPKNIFPNRKIGHLKKGYEASLLILEENPIQDFSAVRKIAVRFKGGQFIK